MKNFSRFKGTLYRQAWQLSIAATLWTIWLARNELVFTNTRISKVTLGQLIIHRAFKWATTNSWIQLEMEKEWSIHPAKAIVQCLHGLKSALWTTLYQKFDFIATFDGSWNHKTSRGGMRGIIKNKHSQIVFLFSGPTLSQGSLYTKIEALCHIIRVRPLLSLTRQLIVVCTDSKQLETEFNNYCGVTREVRSQGSL